MQTVIYKNAIILRYFGTKTREKMCGMYSVSQGLGAAFYPAEKKERKIKWYKENHSPGRCAFSTIIIYTFHRDFSRQKCLSLLYYKRLIPVIFEVN